MGCQRSPSLVRQLCRCDCRPAEVFSHALAVFATASFLDEAVLLASMHQMWAIKYG